MVDGDGDENDIALDHQLPEGGDVEQEQAVVEHADDQAAQHGADDRAAPTCQRRAADDDRGDGIEFVAQAGIGLGRDRPGYL